MPMAGTMTVEIAQLRQRHVIPGKAHPHAPRGGTLVTVSIRPVAQCFPQRLALWQPRWCRAVDIHPDLIGERRRGKPLQAESEARGEFLLCLSLEGLFGE